MTNLPGVNCFQMTDWLMEEPQGMALFIEGLANFFAQAWVFGRANRLKSQERSGLAEVCRVRLDAIAESLPPHLSSSVNQVRKDIDGLFDGSYPIVLTHGDLSEMNMLLNESTGALTGVIDWIEASLLPFGFALYALENALGGMYVGGWAYHNNAAGLRKHFWDTFDAIACPSRAEKERMRVARRAGILFRYGTPVGSGFSGLLGIKGEDGGSLAILEAIISEDME